MINARQAKDNGYMGAYHPRHPALRTSRRHCTKKHTANPMQRQGESKAKSSG